MAAGVDIGSVYTLVDLLKMMNPGDGNLVKVAETLARKNPIVKEVPIIEANQALVHMGGRQGALPSVGKRAINDGAPFAAHKEVPVTAPMSLFEVFAKVDEETIRLAGARAVEVRRRKDAAFVEAMTQALADEIIYGSVADDPLGFNGLATMFDSSSVYPNDDSGWYYNVQKNGGGGSDTTSIWAIEWGAEKAHLIYPKDTTGGIEVNDLGLQLVDGVTSGTKLRMWVTQFKWRCGLFVQDERCVQRIANIETSGTDNIFNEDYLITALNRLPNGGEDGMTRIYVNRTIKTQMEIRLKDKNNVYFRETEGLGGVPVLRFRNVPVQICDGITNAETAIS